MNKTKKEILFAFFPAIIVAFSNTIWMTAFNRKLYYHLNTLIFIAFPVIMGTMLVCDKFDIGKIRKIFSIAVYIPSGLYALLTLAIMINGFTGYAWQLGGLIWFLIGVLHILYMIWFIIAFFTQDNFTRAKKRLGHLIISGKLGASLGALMATAGFVSGLLGVVGFEALYTTFWGAILLGVSLIIMLLYYIVRQIQRKRRT